MRSEIRLIASDIDGTLLRDGALEIAPEIFEHIRRLEGKGICAERNAIFHMLACGESRIRRVLALGRNGEPVPPCGACRELMVQLMPGEAQKVEILLDWETAVTLKELTPNWWI